MWDKYAVAITFVNAIVAVILVFFGTLNGKGALAYDIARACADQNGASRDCTVTYNMVGTYLIMKVGDTQVYCQNGIIESC